MTRRFGEQVAGGEKVMISKCKTGITGFRRRLIQESPVRSQGWILRDFRVRTPYVKYLQPGEPNDDSKDSKDLENSYSSMTQTIFHI